MNSLFCCTFDVIQMTAAIQLPDNCAFTGSVFAIFTAIVMPIRTVFYTIRFRCSKYAVTSDTGQLREPVTLVLLTNQA